LFLLGKLYLAAVLLLLNDLGERGALVLPVVELCLKLHALLEGVVHYVPVLLQLMDLDLVLLELLVALALLVPDLTLKLRDYLIAALLRVLFESRDLVLKLDRVLKLVIILRL
jgi:hypothetical protein